MHVIGENNVQAEVRSDPLRRRVDEAARVRIERKNEDIRIRREILVCLNARMREKKLEKGRGVCVCVWCIYRERERDNVCVYLYVNVFVCV